MKGRVLAKIEQYFSQSKTRSILEILSVVYPPHIRRGRLQKLRARWAKFGHWSDCVDP